MEMPEGTLVAIGTDLMNRIGIYLGGLATSWEKTTPVIEEINDLLTPDASPAGTPMDQNKFLAAIQPLIEQKQKIQSRPFALHPSRLLCWRQRLAKRLT